jgi:hypothetical protein
MPENDRPDEHDDTDVGTDTSTVDENANEEEHDEPRPATKADGTPYTQADIDALNEALRKARQAERRLKRGGQRPAQAQDGASEEDTEKIRAEVETAAAGKWKPVVVRQAARAAFADAGLILPKSGGDEALARVLRLLDMDDIDVTDEGAVEGLTEQVEEIRRDWPDLFAPPASRNGRPPRVNAGNRDDASGQAPRSAADRIAAQLLSGRR